jgi:hypothetical protein
MRIISPGVAGADPAVLHHLLGRHYVDDHHRYNPRNLDHTWRRQGFGSSSCSKGPKRRKVFGCCSSTSSTCSIGSSSGSDPRWSGWPPRIRLLPLRCFGGLIPVPSLECGVWRNCEKCGRSALPEAG